MTHSMSQVSEGAARNSNSFASRLAACLCIHADLVAENEALRDGAERLKAMKEFFDTGDGKYTISRKSFGDTFAPVFRMSSKSLVTCK